MRVMCADGVPRMGAPGRAYQGSKDGVPGCMGLGPVCVVASALMTSWRLIIAGGTRLRCYFCRHIFQLALTVFGCSRVRKVLVTICHFGW